MKQETKELIKIICSMFIVCLALCSLCLIDKIDMDAYHKQDAESEAFEIYQGRMEYIQKENIPYYTEINEYLIYLTDTYNIDMYVARRVAGAVNRVPSNIDVKDISIGLRYAGVDKNGNIIWRPVLVEELKDYNSDISWEWKVCMSIYQSMNDHKKVNESYTVEQIIFEAINKYNSAF